MYMVEDVTFVSKKELFVKNDGKSYEMYYSAPLSVFVGDM